LLITDKTKRRKLYLACFPLHLMISTFFEIRCHQMSVGLLAPRVIRQFPFSKPASLCLSQLCACAQYSHCLMRKNLCLPLVKSPCFPATNPVDCDSELLPEHECDRKDISHEQHRSSSYFILVLMQAYQSNKGNKIVSLESYF
jgi:hypothetical protein